MHISKIAYARGTSTALAALGLPPVMKTAGALVWEQLQLALRASHLLKTASLQRDRYSHAYMRLGERSNVHPRVLDNTLDWLDSVNAQYADILHRAPENGHVRLDPTTVAVFRRKPAPGNRHTLQVHTVYGIDPKTGKLMPPPGAELNEKLTRQIVDGTVDTKLYPKVDKSFKGVPAIPQKQQIKQLRTDFSLSKNQLRNAAGRVTEEVATLPQGQSFSARALSPELGMSKNMVQRFQQRLSKMPFLKLK